MSGVWSMEISFLSRRKKRQNPHETTGSTSEDLQRQTAEPVASPVTVEDSSSARQGRWPGRRKRQEPDEPSQSSAEKPQQRASEPTASPVTPNSPPTARQLWGQNVAVVQEGLSQEQAERFVEDLKAEYEARLKEKEESPAWDSFSKFG